MIFRAFLVRYSTYVEVCPIKIHISKTCILVVYLPNRYRTLGTSTVPVMGTRKYQSHHYCTVTVPYSSVPVLTLRRIEVK